MILCYCVVVWSTSETIGFGDFNLKVPLVIVTLNIIHKLIT